MRALCAALCDSGRSVWGRHPLAAGCSQRGAGGLLGGLVGVLGARRDGRRPHAQNHRPQGTGSRVDSGTDGHPSEGSDSTGHAPLPPEEGYLVNTQTEGERETPEFVGEEGCLVLWAWSRSVMQLRGTRVSEWLYSPYSVGRRPLPPVYRQQQGLSDCCRRRRQARADRNPERPALRTPEPPTRSPKPTTRTSGGIGGPVLSEGSERYGAPHWSRGSGQGVCLSEPSDGCGCLRVQRGGRGSGPTPLDTPQVSFALNPQTEYLSEPSASLGGAA
jgi:hypothetical protein